MRDKPIFIPELNERVKKYLMKYPGYVRVPLTRHRVKKTARRLHFMTVGGIYFKRQKYPEKREKKYDPSDGELQKGFESMP